MFVRQANGNRNILKMGYTGFGIKFIEHLFERSYTCGHLRIAFIAKFKDMARAS